jgi:HSP20 family protein
MYRTFGPLSIWREMDRLQREMDSLFRGASPSPVSRAPSYPAINIWTKEDSQVITAEMPGLDADDIDIDVTAESLTLSGERRADTGPNGNSYHRRERDYGEFSRTIQLPFMVDINRVDAQLINGILQITLHRAEADKPKKISIKAK